ncbi:MAG: phage holin family protein, partial [Usitatibacteraceae bacterium]
MGSVKRLVSSLFAIFATRLELLANELQEERLRLTQMLLLALFALFCFGMALLLLTVFVVVLFWDDHRLAVLGGTCAVFSIAGVVLILRLRATGRAGSKLFSASLAELEKDGQALREVNEYAARR